MTYEEFHRRFGSAVRTKNIRVGGEDTPEKVARNKPVHHLPPRGEAPDDLIRLDPWEAEYLFNVAGTATEGIVETGRWRCGSTIVLAAAAPEVPIWSIDLSPKDDAWARGFIEKAALNPRVDMIVGDSRKTRYPQIGAYDVLFIDGDHSYEGRIDDMENWWPQLSAGGHMILHDSYPDQPVMKAVSDFCVRRADELVIMQPPWRNRDHWRHPVGSMAHAIKR